MAEQPVEKPLHHRLWDEFHEAIDGKTDEEIERDQERIGRLASDCLHESMKEHRRRNPKKGPANGP